MDTQRKRAQQPEAIAEWSQDYNAFKIQWGILDEDTWNFDECGMRSGIAKSQFIFTQMGHSVFIPQGNNRELVSLVETISGARVVIPPMIIVGAKTILEGWCEELPDGYLLNTTESGYSNDVTCLDYIKHFHNYAEDARRMKVQR
jgi:hypothetical protein